MTARSYLLLGFLFALLVYAPFANAETQTMCYATDVNVGAFQDIWDTAVSLMNSGAVTLKSQGSCQSQDAYSWFGKVKSGYAFQIFDNFGCASQSSGRWRGYYWTGDPTQNAACYAVNVALLPPPPQPAYCDDGFHTDATDEEGLDCGGSCNSVCINSCPSNAPYFDPAGDGTGKCVQEVATDNYGNCPDLVNWFYYPASETTNAFCSRVTDPYKSKNVAVLPDAADPWAVATVSTTTGSASVVDNGDGTSTKTSTSLTTNPDGSSKATITTETIDNTTGQVTGTDSTTTNLASADSTWSTDAKKIVEAIKALDVTVNVDTSAIAPDVVAGLTEDIGTSGTAAEGLAESASTATADSIETMATDEIDSITDEFSAENENWITNETITDQVKGILPAPQACTDLLVNITAGKSLVIPCTATNRIKTLLTFVFSVLTLLYVYDVVFNRDIVKS